MRATLPSGTPVETFGNSTAGRGIVVLTDIGGLRPLFSDIGQNVANQTGAGVAVVELWPGDERLSKDEKWAKVPFVDQARRIADLEAAANLLGTPSCGLIGFCMGGMYAFRAAAMSQRFDRIVSFYGMIRLPEEAKSPLQTDPLDSLKDPEIAPTLAIMGGRDPWCPAEHVEELKALGTTQVVEYPEAGHAFAHDPGHENYRAGDSEDAWRKAFEFLDSARM